MTSNPGDRSNPREAIRQFLLHLPASVAELEQAVRELLNSAWEEPLRRRAHEISEALAEASAASGLSDLAALARAMASLLRLRLEDTLAIQGELRAKLLELLGLLREIRQKSEKSAQA